MPSSQQLLMHTDTLAVMHVVPHSIGDSIQPCLTYKVLSRARAAANWQQTRA
jgi:hypothetical protein